MNGTYALPATLTSQPPSMPDSDQRRSNRACYERADPVGGGPAVVQEHKGDDGGRHDHCGEGSSLRGHVFAAEFVNASSAAYWTRPAETRQGAPEGEGSILGHRYIVA